MSSIVKMEYSLVNAFLYWDLMIISITKVIFLKCVVLMLLFSLSDILKSKKKKKKKKKKKNLMVYQ